MDYMDRLRQGAIAEFSKKMQLEEQTLLKADQERIRELQDKLRHIVQITYDEQASIEDGSGPGLSLRVYVLRGCGLVAILALLFGLGCWVGAAHAWDSALAAGHRQALSLLKQYQHAHPNAWKSFVGRMNPS